LRHPYAEYNARRRHSAVGMGLTAQKSKFKAGEILIDP
jgi:hypothetical protein